MSHFTCLVPFEATDNVDDAVYRKLLPFHQYGWGADLGEDEKPYIVFDDQEDDWLNEYKTRTVPMVQIGEQTYGRYDQKFRNPDPFSGGGNFVYPEGAEMIELPAIVVFETFEDYVKDWYGQEERDPEHHRFGYWGNPNDHWDWYQVGGRWTGTLLMKVGAEGNGVYGEPSFLLEHPVKEHDHADVARVGDVDWQGMYDEMINADLKVWELWQETWKEVSAKDLPDEALKKAEADYESNENARKASSSPRDLAYVQETTLAMRELDFFMLSYDRIAQLRLSREAFLHDLSIEALTWAFIDLKGEWNEKGWMGMWGMSADEKPREYGQAFWNFVNSLDPDLWVAVVDCHI